MHIPPWRELPQYLVSHNFSHVNKKELDNFPPNIINYFDLVYKWKIYLMHYIQGKVELSELESLSVDWGEEGSSSLGFMVQ